jgi:hypothetical protein
MAQTEDRPPIDRTLFLPLGIGALSLFGICLILFVNQVNTSRPTIPPPDTATSFKFLFLGTEPGISTLEPDETEFPEGVPTSTRKVGFHVTAVSGISSSRGTPRLTLTLPSDLLFTETPIIVRMPTKTRTPRPVTTPLNLTRTPANLLTLLPPAANTPTVTGVIVVNTPTPTPTSASTPPLNAGTYDDTDYRLIYTGDWISQNNVNGAYQRTLHVSSRVGNSVIFRFIGRELRIFYVGGTSLGTIRLTLNGDNYDLDQSAITGSGEWVLPNVALGTHTVTIRHLSGGSVNLDYVIVPEVPGTATPTATIGP